MEKVLEELFILIAGRSTRQGTSLNESKFGKDYLEETSTVQVSPEDLKRMGISPGDIVRLRTEQGAIEIPCAGAREGELPTGILFMAYGNFSSLLMGADTHGTGMPSSKGLDVYFSRVGPPAPV